MAKPSKKTDAKFWESIEQLEVVDRLTKALASRWGISINFLDTKGYLQRAHPGKLFDPANPVCSAITATEKGYRDRRETAFRLTTDVAYSDKKKLTKCITGVSVFAAPVSAKGHPVGIVYADGFLIEESAHQQQTDIKNYLARIGVTDEGVLNSIKSLTVFDPKDLEFLEQMLDTIRASLLIELVGIDYQEQSSAEQDTHPGLKSQSDANKELIGEAPKMEELYLTLNKIKDAESPILVTGENGTGKEMIATKIHRDSKRRKGKFVALNCGAFNENLLESELFGYVKGAFTGADKDKKGLFEVANNGTLFLDEVGEMSLTMQVKLLRALQEKTFTPVGAIEEKKSNARIIAATNRDLRKMIKEKQFREDLFYRLNVINIQMPALRERKEDIPMLINHFLDKHYDKEKKTMHSSAINILREYAWPGNVRQLENEVRRALVLSEGNEIKESDLSERIVNEVTKSGNILKINDRLKKSFEQQEKQLIINGLKRTNGNKSALAKEMGMSRSTLDQRMKKYGIKQDNSA